MTLQSIFQKTAVFLLVFLLFLTQANGQSTPKYSNAFLSIGVGARAQAMSQSVVASVDDVNAGYWNPAGLLQQKDKIQLSVMHSPMGGGVANYDYAGLSARTSNDAVIGVSMVRFGVDGIPNTLNLIKNGQIDYNRVTEFSAIDYGFIFSYAQKSAIEGLSLGGNAKIIHRRAGEFTKSWGIGVDLGAQYRSKNNWLLGAMARDITTTFNAWSFNFTEEEKDVFTQTGNIIPEQSLEITLPSFLLGAGKRLTFKEDFSLLTEGSLEMTTDGKRNTLLKTSFVSIDPKLGIEADYKNIVYLRAGIGNFQQQLALNEIEKKEWTFQPSIGVGLRFKQIAIDYAFTDVGNQSAALYSNVFSVRFAINPKS